MNAIKKQKLGTWLTLVVIILGIVSVIIYSVNGSVEGYFKGTNQSSVVIMSVLAIVFAVISIILAQFSAKRPRSTENFPSYHQKSGGQTDGPLQ